MGCRFREKSSGTTTYQGVDGYTPIAAYLGNEGWCIGLELRPGVQHAARDTAYFLERILPRAVRLTTADRCAIRPSAGGLRLYCRRSCTALRGLSNTPGAWSWISVTVSSPICASLFTCRRGCRYRLHEAAKLLSQATSFATECPEGRARA